MFLGLGEMKYRFHWLASAGTHGAAVRGSVRSNGLGAWTLEVRGAGLDRAFACKSLPSRNRSQIVHAIATAARLVCFQRSESLTKPDVVATRRRHLLSGVVLSEDRRFSGPRTQRNEKCTKRCKFLDCG